MAKRSWVRLSVDWIFTGRARKPMEHGLCQFDQGSSSLKPQLLRSGGGEVLTPAGLLASDRPIVKASTVSRLLMPASHPISPIGLVSAL